MAFTKEQIKDFKERIIFKVAFENKSLNNILREDGMPKHNSVYKWLAEDKEFANNYARARDIRADVIFDEILEIADNKEGDFVEETKDDGTVITKVNHENIQRSRLRVDARKWILAKMAPKKYSDKIDVTSNGENIEDKKTISITLPGGKVIDDFKID